MKKDMNRRQFFALSGASLAGMALTRAAGADDQPRPNRDRESYTFAVVADPHLRDNRASQLSGPDKFRRVISLIEDLDPSPEFMLLLGDIHVTEFEELVPEIPLPVHAVAGNHDSKAERELLRSLFPDDFGERDFYRFEHQGDLYIGMSNSAHGDHVGHFETESNTPAVGQCEWIEEQLAAHERYNRVFIFGHVPPHPNLQPNSMSLGQNDGRWLHEQVRKVRPTALFFGHRHYREWTDIDGVPVYGMRSCNWNFGDEPNGFGLARTTADGIEMEFIEVDPHE